MTTLRAAALLLALDAAWMIWSAVAWGGPADEPAPAWFPPLWLRVGVLLAAAVGVWWGVRGAWWGAVVLSAVLVVVALTAGAMLWAGGGFTKPGGRVLLATVAIALALELGALVLLLVPASRRTLGV